MEMCTELEIHMLNGRITGDKESEYTNKTENAWFKQITYE